MDPASPAPELDPRAETSAPADPREKIVDALLGLLKEKSWTAIGLGEIATRAGVSLAELRNLFPSKGAIVSGFIRKIDLEVLAHDVKDMAGEPVRERLFDVLMRRFEALAPQRDALRTVREGLRTDPMGAAAMNQVAVSSMQWMLAAAGVPESGPLGSARAQGLVLVMARVFPTFLADHEPGLSRTMKALDEELRKAERWAERVNDLERLGAPLRDAMDRLFGGRSRRGKDRDDDVATAA
jgi:AcrR family transcriptional regulator